MRRTINNSIEIEAGISEISSAVPALKPSEIIAYAYQDMANDFKSGEIDNSIWEALLKYRPEDQKYANQSGFSSTKNIYIDDDAYDTVIVGNKPNNIWAYMKRDGVKRAPLAFVTKLVLNYARMKLSKPEIEDGCKSFKEMFTLGDLNSEDVGRLARVNRYINLLLHTDPESMEKIRKIDEVLMKED